MGLPTAMCQTAQLASPPAAVGLSPSGCQSPSRSLPELPGPVCACCMLPGTSAELVMLTAGAALRGRRMAAPLAWRAVNRVLVEAGRVPSASRLWGWLWGLQALLTGRGGWRGGRA